MDPEKLKMLVDMGFDADQAAEALSETNDLALAVEKLSEMSMPGWSDAPSTSSGGGFNKNSEGGGKVSGTGSGVESSGSGSGSGGGSNAAGQKAARRGEKSMPNRAAKVKEHRPGDWVCPNPLCGDLVFGYVMHAAYSVRAHA